MDIKTALAGIRKDPNLKKAFIENPTKTMTGLGFNANKLVVNSKNKLIAGTKGVLQATTVCASVGCVVCGSVGTDV